MTNGSNTLNEVYFDDFEVTLTEGKVVQSNNYYPFGLQQNTSWTRMDQTPNAHKFNAATEYNDFTDTYDTPFRQYDPATGRFNGVDALAHMTPTLTPYRFGFNNPVSFNDPTGLFEKPYELTMIDKHGGSILTGAENMYSMSWLSGSMGRVGVSNWVNQLWRGAGAAGMERNARMMNKQTFDRFYNVTDDNRFDIARSASSAPDREDVERVIKKFWDYSENGKIFYKKDGKYHVDIDFVERFLEVPTQNGGQQLGWFDDEQGKFIGEHWLNGSGTDIRIDNEEWSEYMRSSVAINNLLMKMINHDMPTREGASNFWLRAKGNTGVNDRRTGLGMLHHTDNLYIHWNISPINETEFLYQATLIWVDRIDPNSAQGDGPFAWAAKQFGYKPKDYNITIRWTQSFIASPK